MATVNDAQSHIVVSAPPGNNSIILDSPAGVIPAPLSGATGGFLDPSVVPNIGISSTIVNTPSGVLFRSPA